jgi:hypothetical protein
MRCPIFYDWGRRRTEAYCEHSHDRYRGAYGKNTQEHLRKSLALLASACFAHMRRLCALRGLGLWQWTLAHAAPLRVCFLKADTHSDDLVPNHRETNLTPTTPRSFHTNSQSR